MTQTPALFLQDRRRRLLQAGLLGGLILLGGALSARPAQAQSGPSVNLDVARAEQAAGHVTLIDIREPDEHATGVAAGARLLPMSQLGQRLGEIPKDQPVLLVCNTQNRSSKVAAALRERGYSNVRYVEGGMSAWNLRRWPVVKPAAAGASTSR
jgi:rhodanese-related sulfurtransferase